MSNVIITIYIIYIFVRNVNGEEVTILFPALPIPESAPIPIEASIPVAIPVGAEISTKATTSSATLAITIKAATTPETTALIESKTTTALTPAILSAPTTAPNIATITNYRKETDNTLPPDEPFFGVEDVTIPATTALTETKTAITLIPAVPSAQTTTPRIEIITNYRKETDNTSPHDELLFTAEAVTAPETTTVTEATIARIEKITNYRKELGNISPSLREGDNQPPSPALTTTEQSTSAAHPTTTLGEENSERHQTEHNYDEWEFGDREWVAEKVVEWIFLFLHSLVGRFPERSKLVEIGKSKGGLPIYAVEVAHWINSGGTIVIDAGYDATDRLGINIALWTLNELVSRAYRNLVTLMGVKIIVVPLINPDNYNRSIWGESLEPCRDNLFSTFDVGQAPQDQCPGFFQDQETIAVSNYYQKIKKFKLYISIHSGADTVGYPLGYRFENHHNSSEMAENIARVVKGKLGRNVTVNSLYWILDNINGTSIDWLFEKVGVHYSIYLCVQRSITFADQINTLKVNYEAIRYGILQLALTDAEIAWAIYTECEREVSNATRLSINLDLVIFVIIINAWFQ